MPSRSPHAKHRLTGALLPGAVKQRHKTETPALVALMALDQPWLDRAHLGELQAIGLLWHLVSGDALGMDVTDKIAAEFERTRDFGPKSR